jgi:hypothetical protein
LTVQRFSKPPPSATRPSLRTTVESIKARYESSKFQNPNSKEVSKSQFEVLVKGPVQEGLGSTLLIEGWSFFGTWNLEFGVSVVLGHDRRNLFLSFSLW